MDLRLELGTENLSPALVQKVVRQGGKDSFPEARGELQEHLELDLQAKQVQRLTERVGGEWQALRDREVEAFKQNVLPRAQAEAPRVAAVFVDAGRALTRASDQPPGVHAPQWRAPKYACALTRNSQVHKEDPQPQPPAKFLDRERVPKLVREIQRRAGVPTARAVAVTTGAPPVKKKPRRPKKRLTQKGIERLVRTAVASLASIVDFGYMVATEVYRRSLDLAERKAYVCDGDRSNWTLFEEHFRDRGFIPILDFLHLLTYRYGGAYAAGGGPHEQWTRYVTWMRWAWAGEREKLFSALCAAARAVGAPPKDAPEHDRRKILKDAVSYVEHNLERMNYPRYRKLGLPTSSAPVESLIKQFNRRVKGTEKFWTEQGLEAVLQVRAAYLSEDDRVQRYWNTPRPLYRAVGRNRLALAA